MSKPATLTTKEVIAGFGVGHMTVFNWRKGSATKEKLPCSVDADTGRVSYRTSEVKAWAKRHGIDFTAPETSTPEGKPGPKFKRVANATNVVKLPTKKAAPVKSAAPVAAPAA